MSPFYLFWESNMDTHTDTTNLECDAISMDTTEITIKEIPKM